MSPLKRPLWAWLPWLVLLVLAGLYGYELYRETQYGAFPTTSALVVNVVTAAVVLFPLGVAIEAFLQKVLTGTIKPVVRRLAFWTPRILLLLFTVLVATFALDTLQPGVPFLEVLVPLLIHLLPAIMILIATIIAWNHEWAGALFLFTWAVWYLASSAGQFPPSVYAIMSGLPAIVGLLFLLNWRYRKDLRGSAPKSPKAQTP